MQARQLGIYESALCGTAAKRGYTPNLSKSTIYIIIRFPRHKKRATHLDTKPFDADPTVNHATVPNNRPKSRIVHPRISSPDCPLFSHCSPHEMIHPEVHLLLLSTCESTWGLHAKTTRCVGATQHHDAERAGLIQLRFVDRGRLFTLFGFNFSHLQSLYCSCSHVFSEHGSRHGLKHRPSCTNFSWIIPWDPEFERPSAKLLFSLLMGRHIYSKWYLDHWSCKMEIRQWIYSGY